MNNQLLGKMIFRTILLLSVSSINISAQVTVEVSSKFSAVSYSNSAQVSSGNEESFELKQTPEKDIYKVFFSIKSSQLQIIAFDKMDMINDNPNPALLLNQTIRDSSSITLPQIQSKAGIVVAFLNKSKTPVNLSYVVFRIGTRSNSVVRQLKSVVESPILNLAKFYKLPKFKVAVTPCGTVNAFSNPDITVCSELISDLVEKDLTNALYPILMHEMAHSLLNLWNLPGYDNEDIADEFSAAILARVSPDSIKDFIKYLETEDSTTEAIIQLTQGSRHTISIQRARNMKSALSRIKQIEMRWDNLLKPYRRIDSNTRPKKKRG